MPRRREKTELGGKVLMDEALIILQDLEGERLLPPEETGGNGQALGRAVGGGLTHQDALVLWSFGCWGQVAR